MPDDQSRANRANRSGSNWPTSDLVAARAVATPEREALVDAPTGDAWTYRELDAWVGRVAARLRDDDAFPRRVGVLSAPRPAVVALVHGAWRAGRELVPLNAALAPEALATQLHVADVGTLLADADARDLAERAKEADEPEAARDLADATVEHEDEPTDVLVRTLDNTATADATTDATAPAIADAAAGDAAFAATEHEVEPGDVPVVLFTSGSTGAPKAVRLTVANLLSSATASAFRLGVGRTDRWVSPLPTYHMGGLAPIVRCALYGSTVVLQRAFDADATATALVEQDATGVSLVPTALKRLLDVDWTPPASLRFVLLGGAAADPELLRRCNDANVPVYPSYGMTETASQIATATPEQAFADPETVGQPLVNTTVHVADGDGATVPPGDVGELVVSGPTVTPGYLDAEGRGSSSDAFSERGFRTGDRGYRDDDGKVYVTGRGDDMIVTGGENVQPATVEDALRALDAVADAAVVGVDDPEWGERVAALVVADHDEATDADGTTDVDGATNADGATDVDAIRDGVRDRLGAHEMPKTIAFAVSIPRTASGTVDRERVRERLANAE